MNRLDLDVLPFVRELLRAGDESARIGSIAIEMNRLRSGHGDGSVGDLGPRGRMLRSSAVPTRDELIAELRRLIEAHPNEPQHLLKLGDLLQRERRVAEAVECYERAGEIYLQQGFDLKVVAIWSTIVKLDPSRTALRIHLARGYLQLQLRDDAIAELQRAIKDYAKKDDLIGVRLARAELDRIVSPN